MKTEDEIVDRIRKINAKPMLFEFVTDVLIEYLPWDKAKEFLDESKIERVCKCGAKGAPKDNAFCGKCGEKLLSVAEQWDRDRQKLDRESVLKAMRAYVPLGIQKARNRKGISAQRTIHKIDAWVWLLNEGEAKDIFEDVDLEDDYGETFLLEVCRHYGLPEPDEKEIYAA